MRDRPAPDPPRLAAPGSLPRQAQWSASLDIGREGYRVEGAAYQVAMLVFTILGGGVAGVVSTVYSFAGGG